MSDKLNILFVARDTGGCGFFRCVQPANFLNRSGLANAEHVLISPTPEQLMNADLVVMQESGSVNASNLVNFMQQNKIPFITEFDDFIFHISPRNIHGYPAWNPSTLYLHRAVEMMREGAGITVSTPQLGREFFPYNPLIYVIPNYLDKDKWDNPVVKHNDDKIRIGWMGGNAHADDLQMVSAVMDKIVKEYKGKVVFETMGMTPQELHGVFNMKVQDQACPSCGFEGELHHYPGETLDNYPQVLASKGWDIAIAPVINNSFGNAKSDLKIKEYSACGIPVVASSVVPYKEAAQDGADIRLAETFDEWYDQIKLLIENPEIRAEMSANGRKWVSKYWIQDNVHKIAGIYRDIVNRVIPNLGTREDRLQNKKGL